MDRRRINAHSPLPLEECVSGDDLHGTVMVIEGGTDPEQLFAQTQTWTMVEEGIKQLPTKRRSALILRDLQDLSSREEATAARVNVGAMKSRLCGRDGAWQPWSPPETKVCVRVATSCQSWIARLNI